MPIFNKIYCTDCSIRVYRSFNLCGNIKQTFGRGTLPFTQYITIFHFKPAIVANYVNFAYNYSYYVSINFALCFSVFLRQNRHTPIHVTKQRFALYDMMQKVELTKPRMLATSIPWSIFPCWKLETTGKMKQFINTSRCS